MSRREWRELLTGDMLLFDFGGAMPAEILADVIGAAVWGENQPDIRYLLLSGDALAVKSSDGEMILYKTAGVADSFAPLLQEYGMGGLRFAFEEGYDYLPDETPCGAEYDAPQIIREDFLKDYTGASDGGILNAVLEGFGYNPYTTGSYIESDDTRVYVEESGTLRIAPGGFLSFNAETAETRTANDSGAIVRRATALLDAVAADYVGDVSFYVLRAYYDEDAARYIVMYGCAANGIILETPNGYFARFEYAGGELSAAYMDLASYAAAQDFAPPLPLAQAAATLTREARVFELRYVGNGNDGTYVAAWKNEPAAAVPN
jgi:hypothetical protein